MNTVFDRLHTWFLKEDKDISINRFGRTYFIVAATILTLSIFDWTKGMWSQGMGNRITGILAFAFWLLQYVGVIKLMWKGK